MGTSTDDIRKWLLRGKQEGATHVIVACDTFDWTDYPVNVQPGEQVKEMVREYQARSMQKVMEVYNLSLDIETQLGEVRAWHV